MVRIGPGQYLVFGQRKLLLRPVASAHRDQKTGEREAAGTIRSTASQRVVYEPPGDSVGAGDVARRGTDRPPPGPPVPGIGPFEDLLDSEIRLLLPASHPILGEEPKKRRASGKAAQAQCQRGFDGQPSLPGCLGDCSHPFGRPLARTRLVAHQPRPGFVPG